MTTTIEFDVPMLSANIAARNSHDKTRLRYRRRNLLYCVSPGRKLEKGGNLNLLETSIRTPTVPTSAYNRLIVMETDRRSWHSVSPVMVDEERCCVSNYYFSTKSPEQADYYYVTSFMGWPGQHMSRLVSRFDIWMREFVATGLGLNRGRQLGHYF